jgi:hypothetical protein
LKIESVVLEFTGMGKAVEFRIAAVGKPCDDRTAEILDEVGYEVNGDPSSRMIPFRTETLSLGAEGPRGREDIGRKVPSTTGKLVRVSEGRSRLCLHAVLAR